MSFVQRCLDHIVQNRPSSVWIKGGLTFLSYLFRFAVKIRNFAYNKSWLKTTRLSVPVISIGNIVAGGTGKTPLVYMLTKELQHLCKTAILSRGFRSQIEASGHVIKISSKGLPLYSPEQCGDEPFYLGQETLADVWVGRDRVECGRRAIQEGAECLILDDGMQHRRLARDVELVVIDAKDPFSQGEFLPRGKLRDLPERLKQADLIIANHVIDLTHLQALQSQLKKYTHAPVLAMRVELRETEAIKNKRAGVFCGIGNPQRFMDMLNPLGIEIVDTLLLLDHCRPEDEQLHSFAKKCQKMQADYILCTMKDWVKLSSALKCALPIVPVKMELTIFFGKEYWETLIQNITGHVKNRIRS